MFRPATNGLTELDIRMWVLFYCDGKASVNEIADILGLEANLIEDECLALENKGVIARV